MKTKILLTLSLLLFLSMILFFVFSSDNLDLGNDYYYMDEFSASDIGSPYGPVLFKSPDANVIAHFVLFSDVVKAQKEGNYVLACQKPNKQRLKNLFISDFETANCNHTTEVNTAFDEDSALMKQEYEKAILRYGTTRQADTIAAENVMAHSKYLGKWLNSKINYYLIDTEKDIVIGPLTKEELRNKCKSMDIDDSNFF